MTHHFQSADPLEMNHAERIRWFSREILPHEADLRGWLLKRLRGMSNDIEEVVQEAYARLWAADCDNIANPRAYLFVTARNIVGEQARRSRVVAIELMADLDTLGVVGEEVDAHRRLSGQQEIERLKQIVAKLPPKCGRAFELKKFKEMSQREIAAKMGIAESTVEKHLAKALRFVLQEMTAPAESARSEKKSERNLWQKTMM